VTDKDKPAGEVLSSLPSSRPQRRSARRDGSASKRAPAKKRAAPKRAKASAKPRRPAWVRPSRATEAATSKPGARPAQAPEGLELVGTAIQAAGELAQLGLVLGTKALRGAVSRLPRP
jgi:hypothetical protein